MDALTARRLWHLLEPLNAVTYFSPESRSAAADVGLKGFWMGYFAFRASPFGPVAPAVVEATFFNFHRDRVHRAIPDAWRFANVKDILDARSHSASAALRRHLGERGATDLAIAISPTLSEVCESAIGAGRPLFAANREVAKPEDTVADLWQLATTLREHRGDGHVALLTEAALDGCQALVLFAASEGIAPELLRDSRGWSSDEWQDAIQSLIGRHLLQRDGSISDRGKGLRAQIERRTDELAIEPYRVLGERRIAHLVDRLRPAISAIMASEEIRVPNPMGLPRTPNGHQ